MQTKTKIVLLIIVMAATISGLMIGDTPRNRLVLILERPAIEQTAKNYLDAEMGRNYPKVYSMLAPSSTYRRTHTYPQLLQDYKNSPRTISTYKILDIYRLRDNSDREKYPDVDKLVQVEVDITFTDTGENSVYNYCFTFLREKGFWYKG